MGGSLCTFSDTIDLYHYSKCIYCHPFFGQYEFCIIPYSGTLFFCSGLSFLTHPCSLLGCESSVSNWVGDTHVDSKERLRCNNKAPSWICSNNLLPLPASQPCLVCGFSFLNLYIHLVKDPIWVSTCTQVYINGLRYSMSVRNYLTT
mgnify:CR=1 FL=1